MYGEICKCHSNQSLGRYSFNKAKPAKGRREQLEIGFRCQHCGAFVYTLPELSGVINRNHCPFCLWSRHVDYMQAGDRMSACRADMLPIGLTIKPSRNKYPRCCDAGELMLIHRCNDCNKLSINRIAADDQIEMLARVFDSSLELDEATLNELRGAQIQPLMAGDKLLVINQLFGMYR